MGSTFALCVDHQEFCIAQEAKPEGTPEDDIDRLKRFIPSRHMEGFILGCAPVLAAAAAAAAAPDGG